MTIIELKNYIKEQVKTLDNERNEEEDDYTEGRIEGTKYAYLDLLDMIDTLEEG